MNFHSDEWIMMNVKDHLNESLQFFDINNIVCIANQGSGNYGLDYEGSDVDTKLILTPSFAHIAMNTPAISTTHVRADDSHTDWKDIRLYMQTFRKQNINFLEILFTDFAIYNPQYGEQWNRLIEKREDIAHYNLSAAIKAMQGVAAEKYFAMEHHYPSRMEWIEKFGYDPKQLHHLLRMEEFMMLYTAGNTFEYCLKPKNANELIAIKKGKYNLEDARVLANDAKAHIDDMAKTFLAKHINDKSNDEIDKLLNDVQYQIMLASVKLELETK